MSGDEWMMVARLSDVPRQGARVVAGSPAPGIALFRTSDDRIFALENSCPHKKGPLAQGIVHGDAVACPLHNWRISLSSGQALGDDEGCTPSIAVRLEEDRIFIPTSAMAEKVA